MGYEPELSWHESYAAIATSVYGAESLRQKTPLRKVLRAVGKLFVDLGGPVVFEEKTSRKAHN